MIAAARARWRYAAPMSMTDAEQQRVAFSNWLRARMEAHRYATTGDRPGGQVRLAHVTGVSQSILSRALAAKSIPTPEAVIRLAHALDASAPEALRIGGYKEIADVIEQATSGQAPDPEADPIAARIANAPELTGAQRPIVMGYYERRRREAMDGLAEDVEQSIRTIAAANAEFDFAEMDSLVARVRRITDGLTDEERSELETQLLQQIENLRTLTELRAEQLRRAS